YINYFPGWVGISSPKGGLIPSQGAVFKDTEIRKIGNSISLISLIVFVSLFFHKRRLSEK
ncbi:MAG: hypothetical protein AAB656_02775, partial [Patescibacteria group bacterium]